MDPEGEVTVPAEGGEGREEGGEGNEEEAGSRSERQRKRKEEVAASLGSIYLGEQKPRTMVEFGDRGSTFTAKESQEGRSREEEQDPKTAAQIFPFLSFPLISGSKLGSREGR